MSRWFRFYDDAINDPKVLKPSDRLHHVWIGLLCVASKSDGQLPSQEDYALILRCGLKDWLTQSNILSVRTAGSGWNVSRAAQVEREAVQKRHGCNGCRTRAALQGSQEGRSRDRHP
jgi:hypothetical protein